MENIKRIEWIDIAKGIAILLVIFGHSVDNWAIRGLIYSFHMPLFFVLSCVTYKFSNDKNSFITSTKKAFKHLVLPAYALAIIGIFIDYLFIGGGNSIIETIGSHIASLIYFSGSDVHLGKMIIKRVGIPWFLVVLFGSRTISNYIRLHIKNRNKLFLVCIILSILGVYLGYSVWLPFSLDISLAILPFMFAGTMINKNGFNEKAIRIFMLNFLLYCGVYLIQYYFSHDFLDLSKRDYNLYPLCFLLALFGILSFSAFCDYISKFKNLYFIKYIRFIGRNSLYLLCIHAIEAYILDYTYQSILTSYWYINAFFRMILDLTIFGLVMYVRQHFAKTKVV